MLFFLCTADEKNYSHCVASLQLARTRSSCCSVNYASKKKRDLYRTFDCSQEKAQETATSESFSVLSWSCLGRREGREVQGEGGGRWSKVGVPHKGNHWQRSRFILCSLELSMPLSVCIRWESACTCVFQHSLVSLIPTGCLSMLSCQQLVQQSAGEKQNWTW